MKTIQCPQDGVYEEELEVDGGDDDDGGDNDDIGDDDHTYHPLTIADRLDQLTKQLIGKGVATFATFYNRKKEKYMILACHHHQHTVNI